MEERSDLRIGAVELARLGFAVFPAKAIYNEVKHKWDKVPILKDGFKGATTDPERIYDIFPEPSTPDGLYAQELLIGMVHNNMTIMDADGAEGVEELNKILSQLPEASVVVRTISGGIHYYVAGATELEGRKTKARPSLDILTGNNKGFVVVPPSPGYEVIMGSFEQLAEDISSGLGDETTEGSGA